MLSHQAKKDKMFEDRNDPNEPVTFTNIDNEDFGAETWEEEIEVKDSQTKEVRMDRIIHSVDNAMWDSHPYSVKAGETKVYPRFLANHLAKHLINKILGKKDKHLLRNEAARGELAKKIIGVANYTPPSESAPQSEGERVAQMVSELEEESPFQDLDGKVDSGSTGQDLEQLTRAELMNEAKKRGIKIENRDTKKDLIEKINS